MIQSSFEVDIPQLLQELGPSMSSVVARTLIQRSNISPGTARKRIERAKASLLVRELEFRFKHNEQFLFVAEQLGTELFRTRLLAALKETNSVYFLPLCGIAARGGIVLREQFATFSGLPLSSETQLTADQALATLIEMGLLQSEFTAAGHCIQFTSTMAPRILGDKRLIARLEMENTVISAFGDWMKLQGLASSDVATTRTTATTPQFGYFRWDFVAPSYSYPLLKKSKAPGFVVADIHLGRKLNSDDIQYFLHKCNLIRHSHSTPFMAFCIADWFEKDAFMQGRNNALVFTTPKNFFGKAFSLSLDLLMQAFELKDYATTDPEFLSKVTDAIETLDHLTSASRLLKRNLLKIIIGRYFVQTKKAAIQYGISFPDDAGRNEIDLIVQCDETKIVVECDHGEYTVEVQDIQRWLHHVNKWRAKLDTTVSKRLNFMFFSTGWFSKEASQLLLAASGSALESDLQWFDRTGMEKLFASSLDANLIAAFEKICPKG